MSGYAIRQLNPFTGVLQVVETPAARAFSANGVLWRVQVMASRPEHTWRSADRQLQRQFFNWALWSADQGLHRVNANPLMDLGAMQQATDELIGSLEPCLRDLPFALADHYECWCCDEEEKPVALIRSSTQAHHTMESPGIPWHATGLDETRFESKSLAKAGIPNNDGRFARAHAQRLESEVRQRTQSVDWFQRKDNGSGRRMDTGDVLDKADFPLFGIETRWPEPLVADLAGDYIAWLSPLLLLLPLPREQRAELEQLALRRAAQVADQYRLYPEYVQPELIEQARVEARLRRS